jgi:hypothetical protein
MQLVQHLRPMSVDYSARWSRENILVKGCRFFEGLCEQADANNDRTTKRIWGRSLYLWIGTAAVISFNLAAAASPSANLTNAALALTGMFALVGIGFGIWGRP